MAGTLTRTADEHAAAIEKRRGIRPGQGRGPPVGGAPWWVRHSTFRPGEHIASLYRWACWSVRLRVPRTHISLRGIPFGWSHVAQTAERRPRRTDHTSGEACSPPREHGSFAVSQAHNWPYGTRSPQRARVENEASAALPQDERHVPVPDPFCHP